MIFPPQWGTRITSHPLPWYIPSCSSRFSSWKHNSTEHVSTTDTALHFSSSKVSVEGDSNHDSKNTSMPFPDYAVGEQLILSFTDNLKLCSEQIIRMAEALDLQYLSTESQWKEPGFASSIQSRIQFSSAAPFAGYTVCICNCSVYICNEKRTCIA